MGLAVSDLVLVVAGLWVAWHLRSVQPLPARLSGLLGVGLLGAAAVLGAIHYAGYPELAGLHRQASDLGAVLGLPLMMLALAYSRLEMSETAPAWLRQGLVALLVTMVCAVGLLGERMPAAVASLVFLGVAIAVRPQRSAGPGLLILGILGLGAWRGLESVDLSLRLGLLHLGLAVLLLLWLREMGRYLAPEGEKA